MTIRQLLATSLAALIIGGGAAGVIESNTALSLLTQAVIYGLFALGVGVLLRQNGMISFGHALYFGGTGYILGVLLQFQGMPPELAILVALFAVTAFAFLIGLVIVRVPGVSFGMLTLAIGQMFYLTASRARGMTGGADGLNIDWPATLFGLRQSMLLKPAPLFFLCWAVLVVTIAALTLVLRGRFGAITEAVRDNEERARFIGIRTLLPRAGIYALSAFVTGLAGVLFAINTAFVSPENLHWSLSGMALMMVVVGGFHQLWGPPLGAAVYFLFKDLLGDHASHWMAIFGVALIAVIVFSPKGLAGALQKLAPRNRRQSKGVAGQPQTAQGRH